MYNQLTPEIVAQIKAVSDHVFEGVNINPDYAKDEMPIYGTKMPDLAVQPRSTEEVAAVVKICYENNIPVTPRGAGTGLAGGAVPLYGGVLIDISKMNRIVSSDMENFVVNIEAGVLLNDLASDCQSRGMLYPPDPGEKFACVGGNVATNAGGMRAVKYGVTRDAVRALTVVRPTGEILHLGSKVVKNSSGYSLKDLIIGSEGTLAVVTEAILKIIPKPEYAISTLIPFNSMAEAISAVPKIIGAKVTPVAVEYMSQDVILFAEEYLGKKFPTHDSDAYLLLTFDGNTKEAVTHDMETIADLCLELGALDVYMIDTEERSTTVWSARSAFLEAIKGSTDLMDECDVVVPRSLVADFILYTHEVAEKVGLRIPSFGHAGDGNLHIYLCRDGKNNEEWNEKKEKAFDLMYKKSREMGGLVSGEHGIGLDKKEYLYEVLGKEQIEIMKGIKKVFDPNGILNPGKVV